MARKKKASPSCSKAGKALKKNRSWLDATRAGKKLAKCKTKKRK